MTGEKQKKTNRKRKENFEGTEWGKGGKVGAGIKLEKRRETFCFKIREKAANNETREKVAERRWVGVELEKFLVSEGNRKEGAVTKERKKHGVTATTWGGVRG